MDKKVISQIKFEIEQIDELFLSYDSLFSRIKTAKPNIVEVTALASVLHSFYNGLENIFLWIAKEIDQNVPTGDQWHRALLDQMSIVTNNRNAVLRPETSRSLVEYMAFRHFFRHSYSFFIEWEKLEKLITPVRDTWKQAKNEMNKFIRTLSQSH